jgi:hypothetical protein
LLALGGRFERAEIEAEAPAVGDGSIDVRFSTSVGFPAPR